MKIRATSTRLPSATAFLALLALLVIGLVFIQSAKNAGEPFPGPFARHQLVRMIFGFGFFAFFLALPYRRLDDLGGPLYLCGLGLLGYLLAIRFVTGEVERWIRLFGFLSIQPSEIVKVFTILVIAKTLKPSGRGRRSSDELLPLVWLGIPVLMVALQPDLGTALVLPPAYLAMAWCSGVSRKFLGSLVGIGLFMIPIGWFLLRGYQRQRLLVFLDPYDPALRESSYQLRQSLISHGSGGASGKGLFEGTHNTLGYLPEDHNDFIFAVIGEEWGFLGTIGVIGIYLVLFGSCLTIAYRTREPFGRLVVVGLTSMLAFQTFVNIAMTIGLAPVTGLPLPFVSFGGSALFGAFAALGVILGVGLRPQRVLAPDGLRDGTSVVRETPPRA